jgi:hypothetical protein
MLDVLKMTMGVEIIDSSTPPLVMDDRALYPFVRYRFGGHVIPFGIEKVRVEDRDTYVFLTALPIGLGFAARSPFRDDWGTSDIVQKWQTQCSVSALVISA